MLEFKKEEIFIKKYEMVKEKKDFNSIINHSRFFKNSSYTIYIMKRNDTEIKIVMSISKKLWNFVLDFSKKTVNAVCRNKLKRITRSIIDEVKENFPNGKDYIIMIKRNCLEINFQEMKKNLIQLIEEIK